MLLPELPKNFLSNYSQVIYFIKDNKSSRIGKLLSIIPMQVRPVVTGQALWCNCLNKKFYMSPTDLKEQLINTASNLN